MMAADMTATGADGPAVQTVILLVEDSTMARMTAAHYLRQVGYTVIEAANADEAVYLIESGITFDLVFSDIEMPGTLDGNALAGYLESRLPDVPVILTSGNAGARIPRASRAPRPFIHKPYDLEMVETLIKKLLRSG